MRLRVWAAAAVLVLAAAAAPAARADDDALQATRAQTFVVEVCTDATHAGAIGNGVAIARDGETLTIATAAHIVLQKGTLRILDVSRRAYYDVVDVRMLGDYDLALIRVRPQAESPVPPVTLAPAVAGEPVWIWGNTGTGFWELARGTVRETAARIPGVFGSPRITIDCARCAHGDSGSGVFDAHGRLLGILTRAWSKSGGPVLYIEVEPAALISQEVQSDLARQR